MAIKKKKDSGQNHEMIISSIKSDSYIGFSKHTLHISICSIREPLKKLAFLAEKSAKRGFSPLVAKKCFYLFIYFFFKLERDVLKWKDQLTARGLCGLFANNGDFLTCSLSDVEHRYNGMEGDILSSKTMRHEDCIKLDINWLVWKSESSYFHSN